uniref:Uncharacterized protein n=1 Tax=Favella ehrenbergii TaxID=182087 RepID=A0A7S3MNS6_9SPIT|mmetsp:Transcript_41811/g.55119  ORF Transcript_41811/g.55119 Transcript_41811/m.55119 type:complete len:136 (+) Transcript_41811:392-799(+)
MKLSSTQKEVVTVFLTDANFETVLATPYDLTSIAAPQKSQIGITIFYVPTSQQNAASNDSLNSWTGYKSQPWPAASWTEMYRFEKDDKATGLIYNAPATGASKWLDESKTLKGAFNALTGATLLSLVAGICAISF